MDDLQRKLRKLKVTLGERKYSLFWHNCESYCMGIADPQGRFAAGGITSVQVYGVLALLAVLVVMSIVILILLSLKKKKKTSINTKTADLSVKNSETPELLLRNLG